MTDADVSIFDFLRAQLDEDERAARAVADHRQRPGELRWAQTDPERRPGLIGDEAGKVVTYDEGSPNEWQAAHIARHDPARVLRRVTAARRILDLHDRDHECSVYDSHGDVDNCAWILKGDTCSTVRLMFDEYADRPGYRPEWGTP